MAATFFREVTGTEDGDPRSASAIITGHSSGGGLAGFVASIYGQDAVIFDNMAFEGASSALVSRAQQDGFYQPLFFNGAPPTGPVDFNGIDAYAVSGEFLALDRRRQQTDVENLDSHGSWLLDPVNVLHSQAMLSILMYAKELPSSGWTSIGINLWNSLLNGELATTAGFRVGPESCSF